MKQIFVVLFLGLVAITKAQTPSLEKIWVTDTVIAVPESVLPDFNNNTLYISLVDGAPWIADGKGGVGKLSMDGKHYDSTWITGLDAPKGMGIYGNRLFIADLSNVVVVDIKQGKIEKKIAIDSASWLNDISINNEGVVFVSDSKTGKVWSIKNDQPSLFLSDIKGVNGLKCVNNDLFIGGGKSFLKANMQKQLSTIALLPESIDGIEPVGNGDFILSAWIGVIYYLAADGKITVLLDTHLQKKNTADIGYDNAKKIIYVPGFFGKTITAYKLK